MKSALRQKRLAQLRLQRKRLVMLVGALLFILLLQTLFLFSKHERLIIQPPELIQSYWVQGNRFSPSYLEAQAKYICHLMLDVTPASIQENGAILLRYAEPAAYGPLKAQLMNDEKRLRKQQASLHFSSKSIALDLPNLTAHVTGELHRYVGTKKIDSDLSTWQVVFSQQQGRLFLKAFGPVELPQESVK